MRVDAHHHLWTLARGDYDWLAPDMTPLYRDFDPTLLRPLLDTARIDATILVQAAPTEAETAFLLDIAARHGWIAGVVGWTDLSAPGAADRVAALAVPGGLVGFRPMLQDLDDPAWILRPDVAPALDAMVRHGLVFDALIRPAQLGVIVELARRFPALSIVVDHAGKPAGGLPSAAWRTGIDALAASPNVSVKLSGLLTEAPADAAAEHLAPVFAALLASFGESRILWGSDWPVLNMASDYPRWVATTGLLLASLDRTACDAIWGGNAARIYRIGVMT